MDKASVRQVANAQPRGQSNLIPLLATLSGACGLAYEILYIRLFTNYFGDSFLVTGVTLCTVFLGIAFGAWVSSQFLRLLWIVEAFIGLYAFGAGWALSNWGFEIAAWGGSPLLNAVKLGLLLGLPAFLIGTCVPLFAAYARFTTIDAASVFARVYGLYNLGAFLSVLAIEFALFRMLGLQQTLILIGCLNLSVAAALLVQGHHKLSGNSTPPTARLSFHVVVALALASFASGVFQLLMLRC